jgi:hypothetical protein
VNDLDRLTIRGGQKYGVIDGPSGRMIFPAHAAEEEEEEVAPVIPLYDEEEVAPVIPLYDVVTIGGYSYNVGGASESINEFFGEKNHIFAARQTAEEVNAGNWSWGRGDQKTYFAIAAIITGTRQYIPDYDGEWWNEIIPQWMLAARNGGHSDVGGAVTLTLQMGVLASPPADAA